MNRNNLRNIRIRLGLSQKDIADMAGTSFQNVSMWERGVRGIDDIYLRKISEGTNYSIGQILGHEDINNSLREKQFGSKPSTIDPQRLKLAQEAIETVIKENKLKLSTTEITEFLSQVYNQTLKYEIQGETASPKVIAELLIAKGAGY